ncbi:MAG: hypothetical protein ABL867_05480 [Rickettsiales bacterium]
MVEVKRDVVWIASDNKTVPKLAEIAAHNNGKFELIYITDIGKAVESLRKVSNGIEQKPKLIVTDIKNENHNSTQEMIRLANSSGIETVPMAKIPTRGTYVYISEYDPTQSPGKKVGSQISM